MRILVTRKEHTCHSCGRTIAKGDRVLVVYWEMSNGQARREYHCEKCGADKCFHIYKILSRATEIEGA